MKVTYKYIVLGIVLTLILTTVVGCKNKSNAEPQQPPVLGEADNNSNPKDNGNPSLVGNKPKDLEDTSEKTPLVTLVDEKGKEVTIEANSEKLLIMTFWVDWSRESKEQLEILENVYPLLQDEVSFIGIHATGLDSISKETVRDKISLSKYSFQMVLDEELTAQQKYYVGSFPTTILLDYQGNILKSFTKVLPEDELLEEVKSLLEKNLP